MQNSSSSRTVFYYNLFFVETPCTISAFLSLNCNIPSNYSHENMILSNLYNYAKEKVLK